jgi:hypothetical protein
MILLSHNSVRIHFHRLNRGDKIFSSKASQAFIFFIVLSILRWGFLLRHNLVVWLCLWQKLPKYTSRALIFLPTCFTKWNPMWCSNFIATRVIRVFVIFICCFVDLYGSFQACYFNILITESLKTIFRIIPFTVGHFLNLSILFTLQYYQ